ncbi:hypothetical protein APY94_04240 [Thermococcus celericrescens]|uniref:Uncharacterized protein n=1 Tax=Thermococcus celericrescens TaxID=227598 RepID=A0A100XYF3_9EURY|nr:hypothetical protein [Thermococcus celericrescens]KUH33946.1 hypothetical protein APY94_04240 [Thermococcus celericrescens]
MRLNRRDLLWMVLLLIPLAAFYVPSNIVRYPPFLIASVIVFVISLFMYHRARKKSEVGLEAFLSVQFIGLVLGQVESLLGVLLFILLAGVLTAWLPDSVSNGEPLGTIGAILYTSSIALLTYWLVEPKQKRSERRELRKTRYLVTALSIPSWDADRVLHADCDMLRRNSAELNNGPKRQKRQNIVPLFQAISYHLPRLERVFLLVSESILNWKDDRTTQYAREYLSERGFDAQGSAFEAKMRAFFLKLSECTGRPVLIRWPDGRRESIGSGEGVIEFVMVPAGNFDDVEECREAIKGALGEILKKESGEVTFDVTGGKTLVSVAMALEAIKGDCQAEYTKQEIQDVAPEESLYRVDLDVYSLKDLLNEMARSLNRRL